MPRFVKEIKSTVRLRGKVYRPGEEDKLAAVVSPEEGQRLLDKGALEGDWDFAPREVPAEKSAPESAPPTADEVLIQKLQEAGYETEEAVKAASEADLKAKGFNAAGIKAIRKLYPAE